MGFEYPLELITFVKREWILRGGNGVAEIQKKVRLRGYPKWNSKLLYGQDGWIAKYNFRESLDEYRKQMAMPALDSAQSLVKEIDGIATDLANEIKTAGVKNTSDERLRLHVSYCNLRIAAITKVEAARDTLGGWVSFLERLLDWAPDIDPKMARTLIKNRDALIDRAQAEFGEELKDDTMNAAEASAGTPADDGSEA